MLINPKNIKLNRLIRNVTLNFNTNKKNYGNLVFIPTKNKEELYEVIKSNIMKPQQMQSVFMKRVIKPMDRQPIRYNIGELYSELKANTDGRIIYSKITPNLYGGRNLIYDMTNEFFETEKMVKKIKPGKPGIDYMRSYFRNYLVKHMEQMGYEKNYLIFPMVEYVPSFKNVVIQPVADNTNPAILFLKDLRQEIIEPYQKFDLVIFFNPKANAIIAINPSDPESMTGFQDILMKVTRLNNFNNAETGETLSDIDSDGITDEEMSEEDYEASIKEQLKEVIFKKVAKELKAKNLSDFEYANKEEREIILAIDKRIDDYLDKPENLQKPFTELVKAVETDNTIKSKAIKYVETKRLAQNRAATLSQALTKEVEVLDKVSDLVDDEYSYEPTQFKTKIELDPRIQESTLISMDREYNEKFLRKDINDAIASFSNTTYLPTAITDIQYEDTSDDLNEKETVHVKYKTDENQNLSFTLDIPKIVDDHYIYVNGNKFTIAKQLLRLPIVKTKADRVEITTSYQKMTIERSGSKLSRKNAYLLKILKEYDNPTVEVVYGDNSLINGKYDNDFEYEELSASISIIKNKEITLNFNRTAMEEYAFAIGIPEDFFKNTMTPIGYSVDDKIYYIDNFEVMSAELVNTDEIKTTKVADELHDFILKDVLKLSTAMKASVGKAYIYSTVKFLTVKFPIFVIVGLMNGITNILERHKTKYQLSDKKLNLGNKFVEVKFKDKYFYYEDKIQNTLLLNILYAMNTEDYDFSDFDTDNPYMDYLVDKMNQPMYVKQTLIINLDKMIDPITSAVLTDMKLPTNIYDLLLLANNMLINNSYQPLNDITNYRIRGNEVISAALYEILATAQKNYEQYKMNGNAKNMTIKKTELISKLIAQSNVNTTSI